MPSGLVHDATCHVGRLCNELFVNGRLMLRRQGTPVASNHRKEKNTACMSVILAFALTLLLAALVSEFA